MRTRQSLEYDYGYSLLEMLIGLVIGSLLSAGAVTALMQAVKTQATLDLAVNETKLITELQSILQQLTLDQDSSAITELLRVHPAGQITLANNLPAYVSTTPALQPAELSQAITSTRLDLQAALLVKPETIRNSGILEMQACRQFGRPVPEETRSFLAIGSFGSVELTGEYFPTGSKCYNLKLAQTDSLISTRRTSQELGYIYVLLPVRWIRTFYVAVNGNLRVVYHSGARRLSNQAILQLATPLQIRLRKYHGLSLIRFTFTALNQKTLHLSAINQIPKIQPYNLFFHAN